MHAEHEGLGTNVLCSCMSTFCQTGDHVGKSWNPSYLYHSEVQPGESVSLERSEEQQENGGRETEDSVLEYDSPSCEESEEETFISNNNETNNVSGEIPLLDGEADFLLGTVSRFIRSIRFNNRILF